MPEIVDKHFPLVLKMLTPLAGIFMFTLYGLLKQLIGRKSIKKICNSLRLHSLFYVLIQYKKYGLVPEDREKLSRLTDKKNIMVKRIIQIEAGLIYKFAEKLLDNDMRYMGKNILSMVKTEKFNENDVTVWESLIRNLTEHLDSSMVQFDIPQGYIDKYNEVYMNHAIEQLIKDGHVVLKKKLSVEQKYTCMLDLIKKHYSMDRTDLRIKITSALNGQIEALL